MRLGVRVEFRVRVRVRPEGGGCGGWRVWRVERVEGVGQLGLEDADAGFLIGLFFHEHGHVAQLLDEEGLGKG